MEDKKFKDLESTSSVTENVSSSSSETSNDQTDMAASKVAQRDQPVLYVSKSTSTDAIFTVSTSTSTDSRVSNTTADSSSQHGVLKSECTSTSSQNGNPNKRMSQEILERLSDLDISHVSSKGLPSLPLAESHDDVPFVQTQFYRLKRVTWNGGEAPIVTQNENGPCPLIAIANVLLLRGMIMLPSNTKEVSAANLLDYIGTAIIDNIPQNLTPAVALNIEQNIHDAIAILPHLSTGLDVNIKFTGVRHFEYTPECIIFDLLNIPLYHGWLVDPQSEETVAALGNLGYNQLVERIIVNKGSSNADLVTEALVAEEFLERTATQLTYHGIFELNSSMEEEELAILFRNNHFSTIFKRKNELFLLVTDQGFLGEPSVVWETLCSIDGDGQFVDGHFKTISPVPSEPYLPGRQVTEDEQISHDYLVALSLQEDQKKQQLEHEDKEQVWGEFKQGTPVPEDISDAQLARKLQGDEPQQPQSRTRETQTEQHSSLFKSVQTTERPRIRLCTLL